MTRFQVQEVGANTPNISMVGLQEHCDEYCARANQIMAEHGEKTRFEVVPEVVAPQALATGQPHPKCLYVKRKKRVDNKKVPATLTT